MSGSIVSYRARLARNLRGVPFPARMDDKARSELIRSVADTVTAVAGGNVFTYLSLDQNNRGVARALTERHLISPEFSAEDAPHGVLLSGDSTVSVMLCEEDHLRIQAFGHDLPACLTAAQDLETLIDETHPLAFDESLGFLTACPTNLGTGLRASALMHLPALTETQSMRRLIQQAGASGLAVRGLYGEGTQAAWGYYQISNAVTLGLTEQEIIGVLREITVKIDEREAQARQAIYGSDPMRFEDRVWRAAGTLTNARRISTQEAMEHLATLRTGALLGLLPGVEVKTLDSLEVWPGCLTEAKGPFKDKFSRDEARAAYLRETLKPLIS
ncbi:MAG: ATP--guanido phosphotransferase [Oscillospiraceae bacterium]|jgi:protein arginine kinase|nr:ATP--guanido phosphotransferase [Oscillospiraceae bacterium]